MEEKNSKKRKDIWKKSSPEEIEKNFCIGEAVTREEDGTNFEDEKTENMFCRMWGKYKLDKYLEEFPRD